MLGRFRHRLGRHILLALQVVGCILLDSGNAAANQLVVVDNVVGLGGKHSLDVMLAIAHNKSKTISSLGRWGHLLNLKTLQNRYGEELGGFLGVVEDHAEQKLECDGRKGEAKEYTQERLTIALKLRPLLL
jgi:hypothetical protein